MFPCTYSCLPNRKHFMKADVWVQKLEKLKNPTSWFLLVSLPGILYFVWHLLQSSHFCYNISLTKKNKKNRLVYKVQLSKRRKNRKDKKTKKQILCRWNTETTTCENTEKEKIKTTLVSCSKISTSRTRQIDNIKETGQK